MQGRSSPYEQTQRQKKQLILSCSSKTATPKTNAASILSLLEFGWLASLLLAKSRIFRPE
jgi:hypothetical protein